MRRRSAAAERPLDQSSLAAAASWRPMAYGQFAPNRIEDPVVEPLWGGKRVLVEVTLGGVRIRDTNADDVPGYEALHHAIQSACMAEEALFDGSLMPAPLRDTEGARVRLGMDAAETPGQRVRHMFLGSGVTADRRAALQRADEARAPAPGDEPAAFVAIDLLWLDGQSLLDVPLLERKRVLDSVLDERELVRRSMTVRPPVEMWFAQWRALGFEEMAFKAANGRYHPGTVSSDWAIGVMPRR